jgi:hypothetical protein
VFPWIVIGLTFVIALIAVVVRSQTGQVFISYVQFPDTVSIPLLCRSTSPGRWPAPTTPWPSWPR